MDMKQIRKILRAFLKIGAIILFLFWGITQLLFPVQYHAIMGSSEYNPQSSYDLFIANMIGAFVIGLAYAAWLAADDPVGNVNLIKVLFVSGVLIFFVYIFNLQFRTLSPARWLDAAVIAALLLILMAIYPWNEAMPRKSQYPDLED
jgi:fluoride ion exporter CrcB/FEX